MGVRRVLGHVVGDRMVVRDRMMVVGDRMVAEAVVVVEDRVVHPRAVAGTPVATSQSPFPTVNGRTCMSDVQFGQRREQWTWLVGGCSGRFGGRLWFGVFVVLEVLGRLVSGRSPSIVPVLSTTARRVLYPRWSVGCVSR